MLEYDSSRWETLRKIEKTDEMNTKVGISDNETLCEDHLRRAQR